MDKGGRESKCQRREGEGEQQGKGMGRRGGYIIQKGGDGGDGGGLVKRLGSGESD